LLLYASPGDGARATGRVVALYYEASPVCWSTGDAARPGAARWLDVEIDGDTPERKRQLSCCRQACTRRPETGFALAWAKPKSTQLAGVLPAIALNRALVVRRPGRSSRRSPPWRLDGQGRREVAPEGVEARAGSLEELGFLGRARAAQDRVAMRKRPNALMMSRCASA